MPLVSVPDSLPPEHRYWELDYLFMSPHTSGSRRQRVYLPRTNALFCANLRRYVDGERLLNFVSAERGYRSRRRELEIPVGFRILS